MLEDEKITGVTMASLTEGETLPEVQEHAIAAVQAAVQDAAQSESPDLEAPYGRKKDGTPRKPRGRQKGFSPVRKSQEPFNFGDRREETAPASAGNEPVPKSSKDAAMMASGLIEALTVATISKQWALSKEERLENVYAWEKAFDHHGGVELSPPLMLIGSHARIIMSRALTDTETKSRMQLGIAWVKHKFRRKNRDERAPDDVGR